MATFHFLSFTILFALFLQCALSLGPPEASPAPSSDPGSFAPPPHTESPSSPSPQPESDSDFDSPPPDLAPAFSPPSPSQVPAPEFSISPSPASSLANDTPAAPVPATEVASDITYVNADDNREKHSSSSGGQKAGIAIGVIVGACVVGVGGKVYKKRRDNIRRSRYGYSARGDFL
ncbi:hypothetical protein LguiA_012243 [Lonicera macranthoides]